VLQGAPGDVDGRLRGVAGEEVRADLASQGLQLLNGRRAVNVRADDDHGTPLVLLEPFRQLGDGRGLAGALQSGHENHGGRLSGQIDLFVAASHHGNQLLIDDLDERLPRRQTGLHILTEGPLLHVLDEVLDHRQGDIRLQQGHADFPQGILDIVFGQTRLTANFLEGLG